MRARSAGKGGFTVEWPARVDPSGRYFESANSVPFFLLGDTAWLLPQKTTREDVDLYLRNRAAKGFTVIMVSAVKQLPGISEIGDVNAYGDSAFAGGDLTRPAVTSGNNPRAAAEYDYWDHLDYILDAAGQNGLTVALLPLFVGFGGGGFAYLTPANANAYGRFLGERFGSRPNLIWAMGGDNRPDTAEKRAIWEDVAGGIAAGTPGGAGPHLFTCHVNATNSSSQFFHDAACIRGWAPIPAEQPGHPGRRAGDPQTGLLVLPVRRIPHLRQHERVELRDVCARGHTTGTLAAKRVAAVWVDPRSGQELQAGILQDTAESDFTTPPGWSDAVLLLSALP